jgi:hypothetical protein
MVITVRNDIIAWYERKGFKKTDEFQDFPPAEAGVGVPIGNSELQFITLRKSLE